MVLINNFYIITGSKLSLKTAIFFIYAWAQDYATYKFCDTELFMSKKSIADWKNYLREVCAKSLIKNQKKFGGPLMTVEINESLYSKQKYNVGKVYPQQWVFGDS